MYHFSPFKLFQKSPVTQKEECIYGELYNSDSFLAEHEEIQRRGALPPDEKDCKWEKVVAALMFSSDATHLTQFGVAKGWPIYFMIGNLSKYMCAQPSCGALHHLAYIPSVRDLLHFAAVFMTKSTLVTRFLSRFCISIPCQVEHPKDKDFNSLSP